MAELQVHRTAGRLPICELMVHRRQAAPQRLRNGRRRVCRFLLCLL
jgi:hypothetical protein